MGKITKKLAEDEMRRDAEVVAETLPPGPATDASAPTTGTLATGEYFVAPQDDHELTFRVNKVPSLATMQLHCCVAAAFVDDGVTPDFVTKDIESVADIVSAFVLQHPAAPAAAMLMQIKLSLGVLLFPNHDPRKVELALELFRQVVTGVNAMQRADDEAELLKLQAAEHAEQAAVPRRDDEKAMRPADDPFGPSDFGKSMPGPA